MSRLEGRPSYITEPKSWDVDLLDYVTQVVSLTTGSVTIGAVTQGTSPWITKDASNALGVPPHDYIALSYTGSNLTTVVFKTGGAGGSTVATLTLAYTGAVLDSVTKS